MADEITKIRMGVCDSCLVEAENKKLKQDLSDSEDNAHELQGCYDEMLPLCKKSEKLQAKNKKLHKDIFEMNDKCVAMRRQLQAKVKRLEEELKDYELIKRDYSGIVKNMLWVIKENPDLSKP